METYEGLKKCPHCEGEVKAQAIKCKHCQGNLLDDGHDNEQDLRNKVSMANNLAVSTSENVEDAPKTIINNKKTASSWLLVAAVINYFLAVIFVGIGFYKLFAYENPESGYGTMINAYVGGDAYNYIINANYASAYFTLAIFCAVIAMTLILTYYILDISIAIRKQVSK